jgi:hypothetical protein
MTTLISIESPTQSDYLATLCQEHLSDNERTYVVHAPETEDNQNTWDDCRNTCAALGESWSFHFAHEGKKPAERIITFAEDRDVGQIILIAPDRTATGKIKIGSTTADLLFADSIRGDFTVDGDFLYLEDLTYVPTSE